MIGNIDGRSIWRRKILQPFIFNFEKRGHGEGSPDFGNKIMKLSPVTVKQEHRWMSNQHHHKKKYSSKGSNSVKTNSPNFCFQFEFYNKLNNNNHIKFQPKQTRHFMLLQTRYRIAFSCRPGRGNLGSYNHIPGEFILKIQFVTVTRTTEGNFGR